MNHNLRWRKFLLDGLVVYLQCLGETAFRFTLKPQKPDQVRVKSRLYQFLWQLRSRNIGFNYPMTAAGGVVDWMTQFNNSDQVIEVLRDFCTSQKLKFEELELPPDKPYPHW